jgi:hypothetical protein
MIVARSEFRSSLFQNDRRIRALPAEQSSAASGFITAPPANVMFLSCAIKAAAHAHRLIGIVSATPLRFLTQLVPRPGGDSSVPTMLICARPGRSKRERAMQLEDVTLTLFAACNFIRLFAYLPQIYKAATDKNGASAISYTTWGLFLIANLSTVAYALVNRSDWWLAACFTCNALCCIAILVAVAYRRSLSHARTSPPDDDIVARLATQPVGIHKAVHSCSHRVSH